MKNVFRFGSDMHRKIGIFLYVPKYSNIVIYESSCKLKKKTKKQTETSLIKLTFPIVVSAHLEV